MAAHVIQQVRDALLAQIQAQGSGLSAANVFLFKNRPQDPSKTPFVYVKTGDDVVARESLGFPALVENVVAFEITIVVYQDGDYEAAALDLRTQVEKSLFSTVAAMTLGARVTLLTLNGAKVNEDDVLGAKPVYSIQLDIAVQVRHLESQPDVLQ